MSPYFKVAMFQAKNAMAYPEYILLCSFLCRVDLAYQHQPLVDTLAR